MYKSILFLQENFTLIFTWLISDSLIGTLCTMYQKTNIDDKNKNKDTFTEECFVFRTKMKERSFKLNNT